jgi:hypothetical protein
VCFTKHRNKYCLTLYGVRGRVSSFIALTKLRARQAKTRDLISGSPRPYMLLLVDAYWVCWGFISCFTEIKFWECYVKWSVHVKLLLLLCLLPSPPLLHFGATAQSWNWFMLLGFTKSFSDIIFFSLLYLSSVCFLLGFLCAFISRRPHFFRELLFIYCLRWLLIGNLLINELAYGIIPRFDIRNATARQWVWFWASFVHPSSSQVFSPTWVFSLLSHVSPIDQFRSCFPIKML